MNESGATARSETSGRLLDAAERLFGEHGFDAVGMRELAKAARVNLGATTYHYGSKKKLYIEALMRRLRPCNAEQLAMLRAVRGAERSPTVEAIVDCMVRPVCSLGVTYPDFGALLARNLVLPPAFLQGALQKEMEPKAREFVAALRECLPDTPPALLNMRYLFSMGSLLMLSAQAGRMPPTRNPQVFERMIQELVRFISGGLRSESAPSTPKS